MFCGGHLPGVPEVVSGVKEEMSNTGILCCSHSICSERCVSTRYSLQNKSLHFGHRFGNFIVLHPDVTSDGQNSE